MSVCLLDRLSEHAFARLAELGGDPDALPDAARTLVVVSCAQGIIDNGGLEYFFDSDFPGEPPYAMFVEAYRLIGASSADCIEGAVAMFPFADPNRHVAQRQRFMEALAPGSEFGALSETSCGDASVWTLLSGFAADHRAQIEAS